MTSDPHHFASPHPEGGRAFDLGFSALRTANVTRNVEWSAGNVLSLSFRGNELAGEVGEACNVLKKLDREAMGLVGSRASVNDAAEELADVIICADLAAMDLGIDLGSAVAAKFNATSEKRGLATRLAPPPGVYPGGDRPGQADAAVAEAEAESPCEDVLRGLASYLGVGGYNAVEFDPVVFNRKIRDGIDILVAPFVRDAERYRKLRNTGAAPSGTLHLAQSLVFVGTNLDHFLDCALAGVPIAPSQAVEMDPTQWPKLPEGWRPEATLHSPKQGEQGDGWRAIASAPKDGTQILLWWEKEGQRVGCWEKLGIFGETWFLPAGQAGGGQACRNDDPTHWRPLPAPPTATPSEGTGEGLCKPFRTFAETESLFTVIAADLPRRAPTDAAPAPGHDGESDAAFIERMEANWTRIFAPDVRRLCDMARRTPPTPPASVAGAVRPDDGVTEAEVDAACEHYDKHCPLAPARAHFREILEAARAAAPTNGASR